MRSQLAGIEDLTSFHRNRIVGSIPADVTESTLQGIQAIASTASGAFGDVRLLLLALNMLVSELAPTDDGIQQLLGKLEPLSLVDVISSVDGGESGTSNSAATESAGVDADEGWALREELRAPVESVITAVASAGDEVILRDKRMLVVEMLGSIWRSWRTIARKDLEKGKILGSGASGFVYEARWTPPGAGKNALLLVALKFINIRGDPTERQKQMRSIEIEAGVMRDCKHACVASSHGVFLPEMRKNIAPVGVAAKGGTAETTPVSAGSTPPKKVADERRTGNNEEGIIVMESMSWNVTEAMGENALSSERYRSLVLRDVAEGMAYLHSRGVAHLDLNPKNILLNLELQGKVAKHEYVVVEHAKVSDFGTSRRSNEDIQ